MRIHDYPRYAEVIPEDDVSRLPPHARELSELLHRSRDLSPVFPDERLRAREYGFSLGPEKPAGVYLLLELRPLGPGEIGRGRVFREEALRHLVHPLVRTLCGQYTTDEQLERVPVVEVAPGLRVLLPQNLQYREGPSFLLRRALSSLNGALLSFHFFSHLWNKKRGHAAGTSPFVFLYSIDRFPFRGGSVLPGGLETFLSYEEISVLGSEFAPFFRELVFVEDRIHRTWVDARAAVYALFRVYEKLVLALVYAVYRARFYAGLVLNSDAGLRNDVRHSKYLRIFVMFNILNASLRRKPMSGIRLLLKPRIRLIKSARALLILILSRVAGISRSVACLLALAPCGGSGLGDGFVTGRDFPCGFGLFNRRLGHVRNDRFATAARGEVAEG